MFGRLGPFELILILCIALVVFGPSKLPEIGKSLGRAIREFKKHTNAISKDIDPETPVKSAESETNEQK